MLWRGVGGVGVSEVQARTIHLLTGGAVDRDGKVDAGGGKGLMLVAKITARIGTIDGLVKERDALLGDASSVKFVRVKDSLRREFQCLQEDIKGIPTATPPLDEATLHGLHAE